MRFKISKRRFYQALSTAARAISANSPIPALSGILIEANFDSISLTASDADISIRLKINQSEDKDFEIFDPGSIVIEAKYILEIVRKIDAQEIEVDNVDGSLTLFKGNASEFKINGTKSSDYPDIDFSKPESSFTLASDLFLKMVVQTTFATSDRETRPVLNGVNMRNENGVLECVATDSFRLAKKNLPCSFDGSFNITIPAKSLNEIAKTVDKVNEVEIAVNDKKAQFLLGDTLIQTRLIDGVYPETSRLLPAEYTNEIEMDSRDLLNAIDRASFIKSDGISIIRLQISGQQMIISSKSQEVGSSKEELSNFTYRGEAMEISFSGHYVYEAIRALESAQILIKFSGEMRPFVIFSKEDDSVLQLVLPVRTYN
ncbi:MAG: DNA polymerase III subunit beta [Erysipelotrichaceae bacterium]|jgi:DNA polymerase-3 subunit beta|nr:DNA polymerase III subunit beta [Erysipelotrichaceae bacterium]